MNINKIFKTKKKYVYEMQRSVLLSNLLLSYIITFLVLVFTIGYKNLSDNASLTSQKIIGCYVIAGILFVLWLLWTISIILKIRQLNHKNSKCSLCGITLDLFSCVIIFLFVPIIGFVVNYFLFKQNKTYIHADGLTPKQEKKQIPISVMLVMVTFVAVLIMWLVYAINGKTWADSDSANDGTKYTVPGFFDIVLSPIKGFIGGSTIIVYLLIIGIFLHVVTASKALEAGIGRLMKKLKNKEIVIIPVIMLLFSLGGATFGMCEETIAFYSIVMPIVIAAGFDAIVGVFIILFGAGLGVCSSIINPFVVSTSVDATNAFTNYGLNVSDGILFRVFIYVAFLTIGISFVTIYALKIKKNPKKSLVYNLHSEHIKAFNLSASAPELTIKRKIILGIFMSSFILLIIGAIPWDTLTGWKGFINANDWLVNNFPFLTTNLGAVGAWDLVSFSFLFLMGSFIVCLLEWSGIHNLLTAFYEGAKEMMGLVFVIALSRGLGDLLSSSGFNNVISQGITPALKLNHVLGTIILFLAFCAISFFIPSTSGFAFAVFGPVAAPAMISASGYSVANGISSSSIANGLINLCSPTAGPFLIGCEMAKVPLKKFYKLAWKLLLIVACVGLGMLILGESLFPKVIVGK